MSRVDIRISEEVKSTYEQAAEVIGVSLSDFIKSAAMEKAQQVLTQHKHFQLSEKDWNQFITALDKEEEPNQELKDAVQKYKNDGMK